MLFKSNVYGKNRNWIILRFLFLRIDLFDVSCCVSALETKQCKISIYTILVYSIYAQLMIFFFY